MKQLSYIRTALTISLLSSCTFLTAHAAATSNNSNPALVTIPTFAAKYELNASILLSYE